MRSSLKKVLKAGVIVGSLAAAAFSPAALAEKKDSFRVAWTIYVGWMPWDYATKHGIIDKWADKYGIDIEVVQLNDYIESINQYTAGAFDAGTMTNMDALTIPAAGGVDSTALILGDYSNGNDAIVLKDADKLADIKGRNVNLVELSVSHYALARGLETVGLSERDVKVVNTSDADIVAAYQAPDVNAVTLWNPQLAEVMKDPSAHKVFDSSQIPGEIIDMMVVNSETLKDNPEFGKALVGAWFETMALMSKDDAKAKAARTAMGEASGTDLAGYDAQLEATKMFYTAKEAAAFTTSPDLKKTMDSVRKFSFDHGLLGEGARDVNAVGMAFSDGSVLGDKQNVKLRFDPTYVQMAADGKL
jgi:NitT/TauT family transport system substrate-binding protein